MTFQLKPVSCLLKFRLQSRDYKLASDTELLSLLQLALCTSPFTNVIVRSSTNLGYLTRSFKISLRIINPTLLKGMQKADSETLDLSGIPRVFET